VKIETVDVIFQLCLMLFVDGCQTNIQMEVIIKEPSEYSHVSDPDRLKNRGVSLDKGASTILFNVLRTTRFTITAGLSKMPLTTVY